MTKQMRGLSCFLIILFLAFIDQLSKWYVVEMHFKPRVWGNQPGLDFMTWLTTLSQERLDFGRSEITSFFNLVMVWNKGVSFGMFASTHSWMPYALMVMALSLTVFFLVWMWRSASLLAALPLALVISGAVSNVWDRARFGAVVDFLDVHIGDLHWPAFNIADSCIVIGVAGLAVHTLFCNKADKLSHDQTLPDQA